MTKPASKKPKEFKDAASVENVIRSMEQIEMLRANDRALIDQLFNGQRPYTDEEAQRFNIQINVNWQEGKRIMRDANAQLNAALLHDGIMFNCTPEEGKEDKRDEWATIFTQAIHKPLQRNETGRRFYFTIKNRNASVSLHGIGALLWTTNFKWMPRFVPLEDLLIPTETYCDLTNLRYFAVNVYLTPGELMDMAMGDNVVPGWNKGMVAQIMDNMRTQFNQGIPSTWRYQPEAMQNIFKENNGYYYSDAVPKIRARWFFYREVENPKQWYRVMVLREAYGDAKPDTGFLFDGTDKFFANNVSEILSLQYGDNNLVPTLKYHTVRGMGTDLYAPVECLNRLRCQFVQSVFEHLLMYFRIQDPQDRERLKQIVLTQYGVLPEGLNIVPRADRHQIDPNLVDDAMAQMRQIMQESASSYVQNVNDGTSKEMTAKEAQIRLNQATVMVSTMLQSLYIQEAFFYQELVRRFCFKGSNDAEVKQFQQECLRAGIPPELLYNHRAWRVTPERVMGGGDKSQAQMEAQWLWSNQTAFDPSVLPTLKRMVVGTLLNDPNKARLLVPLAKPQATEGVMAAENVFGTLMDGQQCVPRQGIDQQGYIETLLRMANNVVQRIASTSNVGSAQEIIGLMTVIQNAGMHVAILGQDQRYKQLVAQYGNALGQLTNEIKAFAQRFGEQQQAQMQQQQSNPNDAAKASGTMMMAVTKARIAEQSAALKNRQKEIAFQMEQHRKTLSTLGDLGREELRNRMQLLHDHVNHTANLMREMQKPIDSGAN